MNHDRPMVAQRRCARRRPGATTLLAALLLATVGAGASFGLQLHDAAPAGADGCAPSLSVSKTSGLAPGGEAVSVSGSCFDLNKGVYVAFCVVPPPGSLPTPCGGGIDQSGEGGLSHWISSNPPPEGVDLAVPYGPGGSFRVTMTPSAALNKTVDCRRVSCAIVSRNDHTRSGDRSQDVVIPVTFAADAPVALPAPAPATVPLPTPTTAPDTTTTTVPGTTPSTEPPASETTTAVGTESGDTAELLAAPVASDGGSGSGGAAVAVLVVVLVLLVGAGGLGWRVVRRRSCPSAT
jgi:hypothetical protein